VNPDPNNNRSVHPSAAGPHTKSWGNVGAPVSGRFVCVLHVSPLMADRLEAAYTRYRSGVKPPAALVTYAFETFSMSLVALFFCSASA